MTTLPITDRSISIDELLYAYHANGRVCTRTAEMLGVTDHYVRERIKRERPAEIRPIAKRKQSMTVDNLELVFAMLGFDTRAVGEAVGKSTAWAHMELSRRSENFRDMKRDSHGRMPYGPRSKKRD